MVARDTVLGVPWFSRASYSRIREVMEDAHLLPATFDDWEKLAEAAMTVAGKDAAVTVIKVPIDPEVFNSWCASRRFQPNHDCRMEYATEVARALYQSGRA